MTHHARVSLEPAWILHHYPYRDSSLLLEVFSREYGRVGLIARGARSAKGRWQNQLQMLRPLMLSWNMRGELGTLTDVDSRGCMDVFPGRQVLCACYLNELLMRLLTRHDPHPELFAAYEDALLMLGAAEERQIPPLGCGPAPDVHLRDIVAWRYQGIPYKEIGRRQGTSTQLAEMRHKRALRDWPALEALFPEKIAKQSRRKSRR